jgi:DNA-binding CsgD family transcriptional regulator
MLLDKNFLNIKAQRLGLTAEQEEVFMLKFGEGKGNADIAARLGISLNACVQCLGEIYRKAGIEGRSRGKANRLKSELVREAEHQLASRPETAVTCGSDPTDLNDAVCLPEPRHVKLALSSRYIGSERQYLQDWLERIQRHEKNLSSEKGWDEVDHALSDFTEHLSATTTALAANSRYKKAEVVQQILQRIGKLFFKLNPSLNNVSGLDFLTKKNALQRSINAFVARLINQLRLQASNSEEVIQAVILEVLGNGQRVFNDTTRKLPHPRLKTYSAWARKECLDSLVKRYCNASPGDQQRHQSALPEEQRSLMDDKEDIARNLRAIDTAILEMYLISRDPDKANFNFFDILIARWMKAVPWGDESLFPESNAVTDQDDEVNTVDDLDVKAFEWAALKSLRNEYHKLDGKSYLELHEHFERRVEAVKEKYFARFWDGHNDSEYAVAEKYAIVSIPVAFCDQDNALGAEVVHDIWLYCKLASYNYLTDDNLEELDSLLNKARQYPILDFWFNEIDHFTAHLIEDVDVLQ